MAAQVFTNICTYVAGHDFTGDTNDVALQMDMKTPDRTNFGSGGWEEVGFGLRSSALDMKGFWQSATTDAVDVESFPDLGTADRVVTLAPTGVAGDPAYMLQAGKFAYSLGGAIGDMAPFTLNCRGTNGVGVVRGVLTKAKGSVSATGALGSGVQLGAVSSTQYLYASFHVFSAGTTLSVVVESDDNSGFASATTRATIGPLTTTGGTWATRVAGPITDDFFRFRVTAITGTFSVAGAIAVR